MPQVKKKPPPPTTKIIKMKAVPVKKKKPSELKPARDLISETISFVIKGKLTPIKAAVKKKTESDANAIKKSVAKPKKAPQNKPVRKKLEKITTKVQLKTATKPTSAKKKAPDRKPTAKPNTKKVAKIKPKVETAGGSDDKKTQETIQKLLLAANKAINNKTLKKSSKKSGKKKKLAKIKPQPAASKKLVVKKELDCNADEHYSLSDDMSLNELRAPAKLKEEVKKPAKKRANPVKTKDEQKVARKSKLFGFWNGPKRHRVASLNALAKVHCLYENETRGNILDSIEEPIEKKPVIKSERTLRSVPGLRAIGKHWDMHDSTSSSDDSSSSCESSPDSPIKSEPSKKRRRTEIIMDLKDMVVRKRMASLNATAILAASYSVEKRSVKSPKSDDDSYESDSSDDYYATSDDEQIRSKKKCFEADVKKEEDRKVIEVVATPNKKVAVILNQDTDVTITGVYVNSTTRSTHQDGYCSIAGMQYRISATSHTQTASTAVATETVIQTSSSNATESNISDSASSKSYTPLDALSNMQPPPGPGIQHGHPVQHMGPPLPMPPHQLSPGRRHGCASAFSSPHATPTYPPPPPAAHHHLQGELGYVHGYYQPAGPLITVSHAGLGQPPPPPPPTKSAPLSEASPTSTSPSVHQPPPPPSSSNGDSSDSEVIITSVTTSKEAMSQQPPSRYRCAQFPAGPPGYSYNYPPYHYTTPPPTASYAHHELCYPPGPFVHHKYPPATTYRRYITGTPYYSTNPQELYPLPPTGPSQQLVTASPVPPGASNSFQAVPNGPPPPSLIETTFPPPPPTLVESYQPPPHCYPSYGPPPSCYSHSPSRSIPYMNPTYQGCPCPMQSCPKNVHTGPLTGDSKRSSISSIVKDTMPLPPVALALPLEPASATGPPSPARGSAGMPPPPSPAGATYQQQPPPQLPKQESRSPDTTTTATAELKQRKAPRIGKDMVRNTMLLMCNPAQNFVKREIESPKETKCLDEETKQAPIEDLKKVELQPCVATVAETVKVKNMKRKSEDSESLEAKKQKLGSYKDFIKKDTNTVVKMNSGKRKLILQNKRATPKMKLKKRLMNNKDKAVNKRLSISKPLTLHNFKQNCNKRKKKQHVEVIATRKRLKSNQSKSTLSSVGAKNNVDKVIECVVSESSLVQKRTAIDTSALKSVSSVLKHDLVASRKSTIGKKNVQVKRSECKKISVSRRKSKCKEEVAQVVSKIPRRSLQLPRWSNGWMWEGEPYDGKIFLNSEVTDVIRRCYPAMRHCEGDVIEPRDCVLLKAGPKKNDLPFVAKIAALWENPDDGEMMMSLLWYYRPEHTEQGRLPLDQPDEVFASRHKDSNSVACIDDKCYVLTFNEYCRYRKNFKRLEEGVEVTLPCIPIPEPYPRSHLQPPSPLQVSPEMVFFCRRVYDFRQKRIIKNPT